MFKITNLNECGISADDLVPLVTLADDILNSGGYDVESAAICIAAILLGVRLKAVPEFAQPATTTHSADVPGISPDDLRRMMTNAGINIPELARRAGLSVKTIYDFMQPNRRQQSLSAASRRAIFKVFHKSL